MSHPQEPQAKIEVDPAFVSYFEGASTQAVSLNRLAIEQAVADTGIGGVALTFKTEDDLALVTVATARGHFTSPFCNRERAFRSPGGKQEVVQQGVLFALGRISQKDPSSDSSALFDRIR